MMLARLVIYPLASRCRHNCDSANSASWHPLTQCRSAVTLMLSVCCCWDLNLLLELAELQCLRTILRIQVPSKPGRTQGQGL